VTDPTWAGLHVVDRLVGALDDVAALSEAATRTALVGLIDRELRTEDPETRLNPNRGKNQREDLVGIVTAVLNYPRTLPILAKAVALLVPGEPAAEALSTLCDELARMEPVWLSEHDRASLLDELAGQAPTRTVDALFAEAALLTAGRTPARTLRAAVAQLERRPSAVPLFRFLEFTAASAAEADSAGTLWRWIDEHLALVPNHRRAELVALRARLASRPTTSGGQPCLAIRMEPVDEDRFTVVAWLSPDGAHPAPNCGPDDVVSRPQVKHWLAGVLDRHRTTALAPERRARIDFVLPVSHLNEPVDGWELAYNGAAHRLGAQYRVAVRPISRSAEGAERLTHRWKITSRIIHTEHVASDVVEWLASTAHTSLHDLHGADWAWLAITCPMMAAAADAVQAVVDLGTPVAVWVRGDRDAGARHAVLTKVGAARPVDDLPDAVWRFRKLGWEGSDDVRRDLVLLWDDPTRPPPDELTLAPPRPRGAPTR
jgi:hypothetical protein